MDRVEHIDGAMAGRFTLNRDGREIGLLEYVWDSDDTIRATHTYVPAEFRGQKLGDRLFDALMAFVCERDLNLIPECPFIELKLKRLQTDSDS